MPMTEHGVTTTVAPGQEQYKEFTQGKRTYIQYDFRALDGELFSCTAPTLSKAREKKNEWLFGKGE
ncbi:hypothetical protein FACS1894187_19340 [Synergistales bacterium]|nr:hypothetical protein FACS1894187_19340 [Synergistales bacterium]